jgi:predicted unusual protein kinase regulating ubiquinone biosynthesis (AarF/ABC1/UbiB family)
VIRGTEVERLLGMAKIELSSADVDLLCDVLAQDLRELRTEIAHTDHREFREVLVARLERLEALAKTFDAVSTSATASA